MSELQYEYKPDTEEWLILGNEQKFTTEEFITHVWSFFHKHGLVDAQTTKDSVLGENWSQLHATKRQVSYAKETNKKTGKETTTLVPAMVRSWVRINLDYAQSSAYGRTYRKLVASGLNPRNAKDAKELDKQSVDAVKQFSTHLCGKPNMFIS